MKTIQIRKGSWHWWIASNFGGWKRYHDEDQWELRDGKRWFKGTISVENDFCCYARHFALGAFWLLLLTTVVAAVGGVIVKMEYELIKALIHRTWSKEAGTGVAILIVAAAIGALVGTLMYRERTKYERRDRANDRKEAREIEKLKNKDKVSFLKHAYLSIKDKTCFRMEVK